MDANPKSDSTSQAEDAAAERNRRRGLNITLAAGLIIAGVGFIVETRRALEGHLPAWVYVIEWPLLGFIGFRFWRRLIRDDSAPEITPENESNLKRESWKEFSERARQEQGE
jgi:hypothetical protein